jgi:hypothetical protein
VRSRATRLARGIALGQLEARRSMERRCNRRSFRRVSEEPPGLLVQLTLVAIRPM